MASVVGARVLISAAEVDVAGCLVSDGVTVEETVVVLVGTVMVASTELLKGKDFISVFAVAAVDGAEVLISAVGAVVADIVEATVSGIVGIKMFRVEDLVVSPIKNAGGVVMSDNVET